MRGATGRPTRSPLPRLCRRNTALTLPWAAVRAVIEDAIRAHWVELSADSAAWPCDLAGARHVNLIVPSDEKVGGGRRRPDTVTRPGVLAAEAVLEANGIQDLADQIPEIAKAAVGSDLKFNIRVELGGDKPPEGRRQWRG